eukprot:2554118-Pleurochrysis_carterae.AAC.1
MRSRVSVSNAQLRILNEHVVTALSGGAYAFTAATGALQAEDYLSAGVSSFGYSGTIAHAILSGEEATALSNFRG